MTHTRAVLRRSALLTATIALTSAVVAVAGTAALPPPHCSIADAKAHGLVFRRGYSMACGPGFATATLDRVAYRLAGSKCFNGARLYFGRSRYNPRLPATTSSLYLVIDPPRSPGKVAVIDGGIGVVTDSGTLIGGAISGTATVGLDLKHGSFKIHGRSGTANGRKFTGTWSCG